MQEYQQRVIDEREELYDKLVNLNKFICGTAIFDSLDGDEQNRLRAQRFIMNEYADVLTSRIDAF